jgi:putative Ca2+/H+ antiporter (TMEM165/GDT1 family)
MDWKIFSSTFVLIFLAEIGDKTQFAALAASSQTKATVSVLLGVVCALAVAGTIGVMLGRGLGNVLNPQFIKWTSGVIFMGVGLWILMSK